jgi:2-dehydropantoate 2-reductase
VKGHHTAAAAAELAPHLASDGFVLSLQNGLNAEAIAAVVGPSRVLLSLVNFAADVIEPGTIEYGGRGTVVVGEPDGSCSARLDETVALLRSFDPSVTASDNVAGFLWGKLGYGSILIGTALTNDTMADLLSDPTARPILGRIAQEVMNVATASGVRPVGVDGFDAAAFVTGDEARIAATFDDMAEHYRRSAKARSGVWRDLAVRKRRTEVGAILGPVAALGTRKGVATPVLDCLIHAIADIEEGRLELSRGNLTLLTN